jgi:hypothetical protein
MGFMLGLQVKNARIVCQLTAEHGLWWTAGLCASAHAIRAEAMSLPIALQAGRVVCPALRANRRFKDRHFNRTARSILGV